MGVSSRPHRLAGIAAAAGGVLLLVTVATTVMGVGGDAAKVVVADVGETLAALGAAGACLYAAIRSAGRMRSAWVWFGASALSWGAGQATWSVYEVGLGIAVPFPSLADIGFMAAIPLAVVAVLALPASPAGRTYRIRALLDAAIVAACAIYVAWSIGVAELFAGTKIQGLAALMSVVYPWGDIAVIALIGMTQLRAPREARPLLRLLTVVFTLNLVADSAFAYLNLAGSYGVLGSAFDMGWVAAYVVLGVTALLPWPQGEAAAQDGPVRMWQLLLPWVGVAAVIVVSLDDAASGHRVSAVAAWIGSSMGVLFLASQFIVLSDSLRLLVRSRQAEAELRDRTALLAEVIGRAPLGIARIGGDLRLIDGNPRLSEMLALPAAALAGTPFVQFVAEADVPAVRSRMEQMKQGTLDHIEVDGEMRSAAGTGFWAHRSVTAVTDANGRFRYALVMFEDISAKHVVEEKERANLAELERINRLKSEFMSMVSHEFRTALTGIQGYSELLTTDDVSTDEVRQFAGDINSESLRLNRMITEMLDLDRIESGRIQLHPELLDLNALIADVAGRAQLTTSKHAIQLSLQSGMPAIAGDRDRLVQVVSNLLSNAIKYSPRGGEIVVSSRMVDDKVDVAVIDHGQGIPPEFIAKIFGRYERYETAGRPQVVGTGLGLAISQQIVQLHGGRIWVESTLGEGSTFRFTVPVPASGAATKVA